MRTLELENYGVEEMSFNEAKKVDGGWGFLLPIVAGVVELAGTLIGAAHGAMVWDMAMNPNGTKEAAQHGAADGKKAAYAAAMK